MVEIFRILIGSAGRTLAVARVVMRTNLTYRERWVSLAFSGLMPVIVAGLVFRALMAFPSGLRLTEMFGEGALDMYYIVISIIVVLSQVLLHEEISLRVREGTFSSILLLPVSGHELLLGSLLGNVAFVWPAAVALAAIAYFFLGVAFIGISGFLFAVIIISLCIILQGIVSALIGSGAFWFVHTSGVFAFAMLLMNFFGGMIVPLRVLPKILQTIAAYLPFRFIYASPAEFITGHGVLLPLMGMQILWIAILSLVLCVVWRTGLRSFDASGG